MKAKFDLVLRIANASNQTIVSIGNDVSGVNTATGTVGLFCPYGLSAEPPALGMVFKKRRHMSTEAEGTKPMVNHNHKKPQMTGVG